MEGLTKEMLLTDAFELWVAINKVPNIRSVTVKKYIAALENLKIIASEIRLIDLNRHVFQNIINKYGETHEKSTTSEFFHLLKACINDLVHEEIIEKNPIYKINIKGKEAIRKKRKKYLNQSEAIRLVEILKLGDIINRDWFIFLLLKTGLRFSEALGLTPRDFDFKKGTLKINKTWDYKTNNGFDDTKNEGSKRVIVLDLKTILKFEKLLKDLPLDEPFFVEALKEKNSKTIYNATVNDYLIKKCREAGITEVTCHSLRHTHGSILIAEDVSMQSVSKRLGHTNTVITQRVYTHLIEEQKQQDDLKINSILNAF